MSDDLRASIRGFLHCRTCVASGQAELFEVGVSDSALIVLCKKHGLVGGFTPELLGALLRHPLALECECCRDRGAAS